LQESSLKVTSDYSFVIDGNAADVGGGLYIEGRYNAIDGKNYHFLDAYNYNGSGYPNSKISNNIAKNGNGGGIYCKGVSNLVTENSGLYISNLFKIANNKASGNGGGLYIEDSTGYCYAELSHNTAQNGSQLYINTNKSTYDIYKDDSILNFWPFQISGSVGSDTKKDIYCAGYAEIKENILNITNSIKDVYITLEENAYVHRNSTPYINLHISKPSAQVWNSGNVESKHIFVDCGDANTANTIYNSGKIKIVGGYCGVQGQYLVKTTKYFVTFVKDDYSSITSDISYEVAYGTQITRSTNNSSYVRYQFRPVGETDEVTVYYYPYNYLGYYYLSELDSLTWTDDKYTVTSDGVEIAPYFGLKKYTANFASNDTDLGTVNLTSIDSVYADAEVSIGSYGSYKNNLEIEIEDGDWSYTYRVKPTAKEGCEFKGWKLNDSDSYLYIRYSDSVYDLMNEKWEKDGENIINFTAVFEPISYKINCYYTNSSGEIEYVENTYNINGGNFSAKPTSNPPNKDFAYWIFNESDATELGYTVTKDNERNPAKITLTAEGVNVIFNTEKLTDGKIKITSIETGSYGELGQTEEHPMITADYYTKYAVNVELGNSMWKPSDYVEGKTVIYNDFTVAKTYSLTEESKKISQVSEKQFPTKETSAFTNSANELAFSYGQRISGWVVKYEKNSTTRYLTTNLSGGWADSITQPSNGIKNKQLNDVAAYLDQNANVAEFTIIPIWVNVTNVKLIYNSAVDNISYFATNRSLTNITIEANNEGSALGKSVAYFKSNNISIALTTPTWNYVGLNYLYDSANKVYTLAVEPVFVDNLYKVNLNNVLGSINQETTTYKIVDSNNQFVTGELNPNNVLNFNNFENDIKNAYTSTEVNANLFAQNIVNATENYNKVKNSFVYANKVYVSGTNLLINQADTKICSANNNTASFYIYLKNGQETKNIPHFETPTQIFSYWQNDNNCKNAECEDLTALTDVINHRYNENLEVPENSSLANIKDTWEYIDGYKATAGGQSETSLTANWYRKEYKLTINTLLEDVVGQYGYVKITVVESEDNGGAVVGNYLAIYNNGMKIYDIDIENKKYQDYNSELTTEVSELFIKNGCNIIIQVFDIYSDSTVPESMMGYKFNCFLQSELNEELTDSELTIQNLQHEENKHVFCLNINFAKIDYTFNIKMLVDGYEATTDIAGSLGIHWSNGTTEPSKIYHRLAGINVDSVFSVSYARRGGFNIKTDSVLIKLGTEYIPLASNTSTYQIQFTGNWLKNNFYVEGNANPTDEINIYINIETTTYTWALELIADEVEIGTREILTGWKVTNGYTEPIAKLKEVFVNTPDLGYIVEHDDKDYAAVLSYAKLRDKEDKNVLTKTYQFTLTQDNAEFNLSGISQSIITDMEEDNVLTMVLELSEIQKIDAYIYSTVNDPNRDKRVNIKSGNKSITLTQNITSGSIYTHKQLTNKLVTSYNSVVYKGVKVYTSNPDTSLNLTEIPKEFKLKEYPLTEIYVEFILNELTPEVEYTVDGTKQTADYVKTNNLFNPDELEIGYTGEIQVGTVLEMTYTGEVHANYTYSYSVNGTKLTSTSYTVTTNDFAKGELIVEVMLIELEQGSIQVMFNIDEEVGKVYINDEEVEIGINVKVYETHGLNIYLELNEGYSYEGYMHNASTELNTTAEREGNNVSIEITNSFNSTSHSGVYILHITKKEVEVRLSLEGNQQGVYMLASEDGKVESATKLTGITIGNKVGIEEVEKEGIRFNKLIYTTTSGEESKAEGEKEIEITSALLSKLAKEDEKYILEIKVESVNRYTLKIEYAEGSEFKKEVVEINTNKDIKDSEGRSIYYDEGEELEVRVRVKEGSEVGKYVLSIKEDGEELQRGDEIDLTSLVLTHNRTLVLSIEEKGQEVEVVTESVYETLEQIRDNNPTIKSDSEWVNNLTVVGNKYKNKATMQIRYRVKDGNATRELLAKIVINGEIIEISNGEIINSTTGYEVKLMGDYVQINYICEEALEISLEYIQVKIISQ